MEPASSNAVQSTVFAEAWAINAAASPRMTPRSTARSHLGAMGVDLLVAERCLNHSLVGWWRSTISMIIFDRTTPSARSLDRFILACEAGKDWNVIPLKRVVA